MIFDSKAIENIISEEYLPTISENRLNGLTLLNIHRDIEVSVEEVIENMARNELATFD